MNKELPPYVCGLEEFEIRAIALDCGFQLKPQPDGPDDLNPYVYKFANEILSTVPSPEDVARFRKALDENAAPVANNEMTNKEEFERWAAIEQEMDVSPAVFRGTTFANHATEGAWRGWQARQPEIDALKAEVERLREDAERYRWLRNPAVDPGRVIDKRVRHVGPDGETDSIDWEYRSGEELDAAIDAAMKETK